MVRERVMIMIIVVIIIRVMFEVMMGVDLTAC